MCEYAPWVYTSLVDGDLPWNKGSIKNFQEFKSKYSVHDSCWVGLFMDLNSENTAILAIQWDSVWLPEGISESTAYVEDWPYLFIRVEGIEQINTWGYDAVKNVGRSLGELEIEIIDEKNVLAINDVFNGKLQIVFTGGTTFLALDKVKKILNI